MSGENESGSTSAEHITLKVTDFKNGVSFKIKRSTKLEKVMVAFLERRGGNYMPAQRLVTRKAAKAFDQQAEKIAFLEAKVKTLQARLKKSIKKKRKKVKPAPGRRFAMMADVRRVKRRLRRRAIYEDEASDCEVPGTVENLAKAIAEDESEAEDCIEVKNT